MPETRNQLSGLGGQPGSLGTFSCGHRASPHGAAFSPDARGLGILPVLHRVCYLTGGDVPDQLRERERIGSRGRGRRLVAISTAPLSRASLWPPGA